MKLIRQIWKLVHKGLSAEDEASQFFVMMRVYYMITAVYIACFDVFCVHCTGETRLIPLLVVWLGGHILSLVSTYYFSRRISFHIFSVGILTWLITAVYLMGWGYGAQYFLYPLMVLSFFATYKNYLGKAIYTMVLFFLHFALYLFSRQHEALLHFSEGQGIALQLMNTITLFTCMFALCFAFSNTNQTVMSKLAQVNQRLKQDAETDTLTGLINRRRMYEILDETMQSHDSSQTPVSIAMGDIDFFKKINDTKGHNCGDAVLQTIAAYFKEYMAEKGTVCRWGGEEFLFLFPGQDSGSAKALVEAMKEGLADLPIQYREEQLHITMTFGVAEYEAPQSAADWIKASDDRLYLGKSRGRNLVVGN